MHQGAGHLGLRLSPIPPASQGRHRGRESRPRTAASPPARAGTPVVHPRLSPAHLGLLGGLPVLAALSLAGAPALAQGVEPFSGVRALNTARNAAVNLNGGLTKYRPAACMFATDIAGGDCLLQRDAEGYLFRFQGGAPGWQQLGLPATTETELLVSRDGRSVLRVIYNGKPR